MSSAFTLPKRLDDITDPELLPEDWYELRIVKDPKLEPNKILKNFMKANNIDAKRVDDALERAIVENYEEEGKFPGLNLVLDLRTVSDEMEFNGRAFKSWIQWPNRADAKRMNTQGQTLEDEKISKIGQVYSAFTGKDAEGDTIEFETNMSARYYIVVEPDFRNPDKMANAIDMNTPPQAV